MNIAWAVVKFSPKKIQAGRGFEPTTSCDTGAVLYWYRPYFHYCSTDEQIGRIRGRPILLITRMITDRIGLHSVLLP